MVTCNIKKKREATLVMDIAQKDKNKAKWTNQAREWKEAYGPHQLILDKLELCRIAPQAANSLVLSKGNWNEELNTIHKKESDEFITSSVEDLVPILSESEDTSRSDSVCILPSCDDFSPIDVPEEKAVTFSNPLFEFDDEYISSNVNTLFDEVLEDIECKDSYDPNLDESTFLVTPLSDSNEDEYFTPGDDIELLPHHDPSIPKMSVAFILEGFTDEPPHEENDDLFDLEPTNDDRKKILIAPDLKASRALGFVRRPLELLSLEYGNSIS
uniref:Reverse transcriptase domain-containing protein n=1 Tax=Tanacetum cinerariifolium TaxID=118510 RepID=A0A6L2P248_TANCI|nr:hypothetical protein [Tanacetum cinerariifolium]